MDEKTRKGISTGLLGLSLMLCLAGLFGPYWGHAERIRRKLPGVLVA